MCDDAKKVTIVGHVDTNTDNPWRTREDYILDMKRAAQVFRVQLWTLIVTAVIGSAGILFTVWIGAKTVENAGRVKLDVVHTYADCCVKGDTRSTDTAPPSPATR